MKNSHKTAWLKHAKSHQYPTPYILTDLSIVEDKILELKELLPGVEIYYSLKSNNDEAVINTVAKHADGFDIASFGELAMLDRLHADPERINFSNPVKSSRHIAETYKRGIRHYAIDSFDEIRKLAYYAPAASVYLRLKVVDHGSKFPLSKFGLTKDEVIPMARAAKEAGLSVIGLTFHVGSQAEQISVWSSALELCGGLTNDLAQEGIGISVVNIGGGFAADYGQPVPTIRETCKVVNKAIKTYLPNDLRVIAEPGRYIVAESSIIVTSVIARKQRDKKEWLHLDMGAFQGLVEPLEEDTWRYPIFSLTRRDTSVQYNEFILTGPTCDPYDTIGMKYELPASTQLGDRLCIASAGAYTQVYASNFNGFEIPRNYFVENNNTKQAQKT